MIHRIVLRPVLLLVVLFALSSDDRAAAQEASDTLQILFIGNSFTYFNNLPGVLETIAQGLEGPRIQTSAQVAGGYSLSRHIDDGLVPGLLAAGAEGGHPWDWVVLQEQSQLGTDYADPNNGTLGEPKAFYGATRTLSGMIKGEEATPLLYMTWAKKRFPNQTDALAKAYDRMGAELQVPVAPVGIAWNRVVREKPEMDLFSPDGSHPNSLGSYLAACVVYSAITGRSAEGAPPRSDGQPWVDPGIDSPEGAAILIPLDSETASYLQRIAWEAVQSHGGGDPD